MTSIGRENQSYVGALPDKHFYDPQGIEDYLNSHFPGPHQRGKLNSPVVEWGCQVVCFVRRKSPTAAVARMTYTKNLSPTAAVARKTYSNNLGEESHVDNN